MTPRKHCGVLSFLIKIFIQNAKNDFIKDIYSKCQPLIKAKMTSTTAYKFQFFNYIQIDHNQQWYFA